MKNLLFLVAMVLCMACNNSVNQDKAAQTATPVTQTSSMAPAAKAQPAAQQTSTAKEGEINWMTLEEAQSANSKNPKKLIVDMYTPWCGPCKMMDRGTFKDPSIVQHVNQNYYAVKFNAESGSPVTWDGQQYANPNHKADLPPTRRNYPHQFTQAMGIRGYPTLLIFDGNLKMLEQAVGYKRPEDLLQTLKKIEAKG